MKNINQVKLQGFVGNVKDITTRNGKKAISFSVATDYVYTNANGEKVVVTSWTPVVAFAGSRYITALEKIQKGTPVLVHGRLNSISYTAADGQRHTTLEVLATSLSVVVKDTPTAEEEAEEAEALTDDLPQE